VNRVTLSYLAFLLIIFSVGCGSGSSTSTTPPPPAPSVSLAASPTSIASGQSSTLTWSSTNATSAQFDQSIGAVATSGTKTVSPTATTTYTISVSGAGGTATAQAIVTVNAVVAPPTVTISAAPASISSGQMSMLTVTATGATSVAISNNVDGTTYSLSTTGGTQPVNPTKTTTYTATATGAKGPAATASTTVTVIVLGTTINHVIFMLQENRTFDTYFGMLNPFRRANNWNVGDDGKTYDVDGIDDKLAKFSSQDDEGDPPFQLFKLATSCVDDMTSDWIGSYGDVNRYNFSATRPIKMDGFVHIAEDFAKGGFGSGTYTDLTGERSMGYYDQDFLNYYYYMASQFPVSDRWFSPMSSKSIPNRIATYTGGTTQGLVRDPAHNDHLGQLPITTIFEELSNAGVSWKIYYGVTDDNCLAGDETCNSSSPNKFPATTLTYFSYSGRFLYANTAGCVAPAVGSAAVGDTTNAFCIDTTHIAPMTQFSTDMQNGTLPAFAYIEPQYGHSDEHPGSGQSILSGQSFVATLLNKFMASPSWGDSVFFLSFDEGGGPFDHVPPVPLHSNDFTDASLGTVPDISSIAVNADQYGPCVNDGSMHCDVMTNEPGAQTTDAPSLQGFAAQLGFRLPNIIVSPFARKHYVSHTPMDHTAVIKFVENRFIGANAHLTNRDAAQPDLSEFFDFQKIPWATPPTTPAPVTPASLGHDPCNPATMH
jgi:phospholipase C